MKAIPLAVDVERFRTARREKFGAAQRDNGPMVLAVASDTPHTRTSTRSFEDSPSQSRALHRRGLCS